MKTAVIKSSGAGFFSNFRGSISAIRKCEEEGLNPHMDWSNSIYRDDSHGSNVWEYYFEQLSPIEGDVVEVAQDFSWRNLDWTRSEMVRLIDKYVKFKQPVLDRIETFYNENMANKHVLGVHIRLTDKRVAPTETRTIVGVEQYITHIKEYLDKFPESYIYLSTDSTEYINRIISEFGDKVIINNEFMRSSGNNSVHHHMQGSGYTKGLEVIMDTMLLSKCNFLIKGVSNVSLCSLFFNPELESFNIASHYNGDDREDFASNKKISEL